MPIEAFFIDDLFWDNNSYKVPNGLPRFSNRQSFKSSPVMIDYFTGYIDLYGDFNYCLYKGVYYILRQDKPLDINKNHWKYVLVRDVWINLLTQGKIKIQGDAIVWNEDILLSKHLNKCLPSIDNPCDLHFVNFKEVDFDWKKHAKITPININISQTVLSAENLRYFRNSYKNDLVQSLLLAKEHWYLEKPQQGFIVNKLRGTKLNKGWKQKVIDRVNESLRDFSDPEKASKRRIVKVTQVEGNSPLKNLYAISYDTESLGVGEETGQQIEEINLSNLKDVIPIHWVTLKESIPTKTLDEKSGVFNVVAEDYKNEFFLWKIYRKAYLPIRTYRNNKNWLSPKGSSYDLQISRFITEPPQTVALKSGNVGYLWFVDRLDFVLSWFEKSKLEHAWNLYQHYTHLFEPHWVQRFLGCSGMWPIHTFFFYYGSSSRADDYGSLTFAYTLKEKTPAYGWLIYQFLKNPEEWRQFEYLGEPKKKFEWISGIKINFINIFQDRYQWWSTIPEELKEIAGDSLFSKMHLHLDNFSWLAFAPTDKRYGYAYHSEDGFKHLSYVGNNRYTIYAMRADITGNEIKIQNPYAPDRIDEFLRQRISKIDSFTLRDEIELPWELKKGDYLLSSLDYEIKDLTYTSESLSWLSKEEDYGSGSFITGQRRIQDLNLIYSPNDPTSSFWGSKWTFLEGGKAVFAPWLNRQFLGDFRDFKTEYIKPSEIDKGVYLCTNKNGNLEIRGAQVFTYNHFLSRKIDQLIDSVDGRREKTITYIRLFKDGIETPEITRQEGFKDVHTKQILYLFYKANGYEVTVNNAVNDLLLTWNWIDDEDLNKDEGNLFDLKGTPFYAFIRKDKVHLIIKEEYSKELVKSITIKINEFKEGEKENEGINYLKKISLTEKINQRNILSIYTKPFQLKTRFTFKDHEGFDVSVKSLTPTSQKTGANYFLVSSRNNFDVIDEWITVPKKPTDSTLTVPDQFRYDSLALSIERARQDYDISKSRSVDFAYEKHNTAFERAKWDLDYEKTGSYIDLGFKVGNLAATIVKAPFSLAGAVNKKGEVNFPSIVGTYATVWNQYSGVAGDIRNIANLLPEKARRLEQDKEFAAREIAYNSFAIDLAHFRRKQDLLLQINAISNKYERTELNDFNLIEEYNKTNKTDNINLRVYVPTHEQLKYLLAYREEFGVDCYIPDVELELFVGMPANVVRLVNVKDFGLVNVKHKLERDFLKTKLETGIKIVNIGLSRPQERPQADEIDLISYTHQIEEIREQLDRQIGISKDRLRELENSKIECNKKIDDLKKELEEAKKDPKIHIDKIKDLEAKLKEANERLRETADAAHAKDEEINRLKKEKDDLQIKLNVEGNRYSQIFDQFEACKRNIQALTAKKEELEGTVLEQSTQIQNLTTKKEELEGKLLECQRSLAEAQTAGKTPEELKPLQDRIRQLETEKDDLNKKLELEKKLYDQIFNDYEQCRDKVKKLEKENKDWEDENTNLNNQLDEITTEKEELEDKLEKCENQLATRPTGKLSRNVQELKECVKNCVSNVFVEFYRFFLRENHGRGSIDPKVFGGTKPEEYLSDRKTVIDNSMWKPNYFNESINQFFPSFEKQIANWVYDDAKESYPDTIEQYSRQESTRWIQRMQDDSIQRTLGAVYVYLKQGKNPYWGDMANFFHHMMRLKTQIEWWSVYLENVNLNDIEGDKNFKYEFTQFKKRFANRFNSCFANFVPTPTAAKLDDAALENVKNELRVCKGDLNAANDQINHLNRQFTQTNNTLEQYRKALKDKETELTTQTNLAKLYLQEKTKLSNDLGQCRRDLQNFDCPIPDYAEYTRKYRNLTADQWDQKFNLANFWRLKTNEAGKYMLILSSAYYKWKTNAENKGEEYRQILRTIIDIIHSKSNNIYSIAGQNWPYYWATWTQAHLNQAVARNDEWAHHIRTTLPRGATNIQKELPTTKAVRNALAAYDQYVRGKRTEDWKTEETFKEIGRLSLELWNKFILSTNKKLDLWAHYKEENIKRQGAAPIDRAKRGKKPRESED